MATARAGQVGSSVGTGDRQEAVVLQPRSGSLRRVWPAGAEGRDFQILYDTVSQLAGLSDVHSASQLVIERARVLLKCDLAFIALRDQTVLNMLACVGNRTMEFMGLARPVEQGIAVYERRPVYSADFLNDNRLSHHPDTDARVRAEGIKSLLVVPLVGREAIVGMLAVANRSMHSFAEREVHLLSELGAMAAVALDNSRMYSNAIAGAAAADETRAKTQLALQQLEVVQSTTDSMIKALLAGQGLTGVLAILKDAFGLGVIATDWRDVVLAQSGADHWVAPGRVSRALLKASDADGQISESSAGEDPFWRGGHLIVPIATSDERLGHLWFISAPHGGEGEPLVATATRAAKVLALELIRERVAVETERRLGRDLLLNLLGDAPADPVTLESMARQVWRQYGARHRPVTIQVGPDQPTPTSRLERARRLVAEARPGDLVAVHRGGIVLMLGEVDRHRVSDEMMRLQVAMGADGFDLSVVIGTECRDLGQDRACILACLHLHELLGFKPTVWLEELQPLTVLFAAHDHDRLDRFIDSALGGIADRPELLATLHAYYAAGRNRTKAARQLNVHVNTLRYRLERIESVLGKIDDSAKEAAIQLAIAVKGS